ncbi:hypothetical protein BGZ49_008307 [Haplosporangium sp. Z 27]|nr:hypothetical protein BGZ49_008307 [Haplosporangium sp. Z 27]
MFSLFQDPRMDRRPYRHQGQHNYFPSSFSDSVFDPFSYADRGMQSDEHGTYYGKPDTYSRNPSRQQQYQYQRPQQYQSYDDEDDEEEDEDEEEEQEEQEQEQDPYHQYYSQQPQHYPEHHSRHQQQQRQPIQKPQSISPKHTQQQQRQPVQVSQSVSPKHAQQQQRRPAQASQPVSPKHNQQQSRHPGQKPQSGFIHKKHGRRHQKHTAKSSSSQAKAAPRNDEEPADVHSGCEKEIKEPRMSNDISSAFEESRVSPSSDSLETDEQDQETEGSDEDQVLLDRELQQKSSVELEQIELNLDELSKELNSILSGEISNKKRILLTEENLTKAMLKIDAVESGGDSTIRQKRKELINRVEGLLVKVDEFKRLTKTSVPAVEHSYL